MYKRQSQPRVPGLAREQAGIEVKNTNSTEQEIALPDGTKVLLTQNSSLVYQKNFDQTHREVLSLIHI